MQQLSSRLSLPTVSVESSARTYGSAIRQTARLRAAYLHTAILAIRSLHAEIVLFPKPGLVSPVDNGSHSDMDVALFMRSLFSLRHYFLCMTKAGANRASFKELKKFGRQAEQQMLTATAGVNTHRGAIFSLGMLCAAAGYCHAHAVPLSADSIRGILMSQWGDALIQHSIPPALAASNGMRVASVYAVGGAREEGAKGFPAVFEIGLPQLHKSLERGATSSMAQVDALFALMAYMTDTNVYHRGGADGAMLVKQAAQEFMARGGTTEPTWQNTAQRCHQLFVSRRLSPGGAADMLAASWFVFQVSQSHATSIE